MVRAAFLICGIAAVAATLIAVLKVARDELGVELTFELPDFARLENAAAGVIHMTTSSEPGTYQVSTSTRSYALVDLQVTVHELKANSSNASAQGSWHFNDSSRSAWRSSVSSSSAQTLLAAATPSRTSNNVAEIVVQILGMYDSGTNLLADTIMLNFPVCDAKYEGASSQTLRPVTDVCVRLGGLIKHSNPLSLLGAALGQEVHHFNSSMQEINSKNAVLIVAMVRDPLSQLTSWRKAAYEMVHCIRNTTDWTYLDRWITPNCTFDQHGQRENNRNTGRAGGNFTSLPDVWNSYVQGYFSLRAHGGYKHVEILRYEDLVMNTTRIVHRLATLMSLEPPDRIALETGFAKAHGYPRSRTTAAARIRGKQYIDDFLPEELTLACERLNHTLMGFTGYPPDECNLKPQTHRRRRTLPGQHPLRRAGRPPKKFTAGRGQVANKSPRHTAPRQGLAGDVSNRKRLNRNIVTNRLNRYDFDRRRSLGEMPGHRP
eukprot:gb/GFBE01050529.1/.p1 GENE.gb/GFBE01050529.1/~~gb/GFBE01050529.1/.p1  ORF type:complete len:489 (+),score=72.92 gb/GFBE01050529.1/:1-1467(+)